MKIAIVGYGVEGISAYEYLRKIHPDASFEIYDNGTELKQQPPDGAVVHYSVENFHDIDADIVIRTPAIAPSSITTSGDVSSVTKLFFAGCKAPIIGVTGTKGKGTTSTLIANILKEAGVKAWLVGNIGLSALDVIDEVNQFVENGEECVVVYELSSFQLWDLEVSPHIAVVLMIEPEHLDVHNNDMENYVAAKKNVASHQTVDDAVVYFASNPTSEEVAMSSAGKKIPYIVDRMSNDIYVDDQFIVSKKDIALLGEHNIGNVQAAALASWQITHDVAAISRAVTAFQGLPHRLERIGKKNDTLFINDSFASAPPATLAAVRSFSSPKILIMGGFDRGLSFDSLAIDLTNEHELKAIFLVGQTRNKIAKSLKEAGETNFHVIDGDLSEAVAHAYDIAEPGDTIIFSPGCASFDMFKDFTERGNEFKRLVEEL